ncbi:hypothetical protein CHS0354_015717 [Potamilus streckersoni]|uniref:Uncharacterized protein n=1 Tax=Potamilus streckersoni TaxID=2493646 RepID=A0AAE0TJ46_9BIVA|nr:hypothetical protein CHS0354_015717 [Potamilus streckersoni]
METQKFSPMASAGPRHHQACETGITRIYHSTDCGTDQSLMASKVRIISKKLHNVKTGQLRIDICCASIPEKTQQFISKLTASNNARHGVNTYWLNLCTRIQRAVYSGDVKRHVRVYQESDRPPTSKTTLSSPRLAKLLQTMGNPKRHHWHRADIHPRPSSHVRTRDNADPVRAQKNH